MKKFFTLSNATAKEAKAKAAQPARDTPALVLPGPDKVDGAIPLLPEYSWEEIMKHDQAGDLWIVLADKVYSVGEFMTHHPGGPEILKANHGLDATSAFLAAGHPAYALALTKSFLIGRVKRNAPPPLNRAFARSSAKMRVVAEEELRDIPVAIEELKSNGERWINFDVFNNVMSQLEYFKRFGHIYQVKIPNNTASGARRVVMVSDAELLDDVADNTDQFGKKVEGVNFFKQLQAARGSGISIISDSDEYQKIRRIMLPWYSPKHQRTQFEIMKDIANQLMTVWDAIPDDHPIDAKDWMTRYCLEISGRGACQYNFNSINQESLSACPFGAAIVECLREGLSRVVEPAPDRYVPFKESETRTKSRKFYKQSRYIFNIGDRIVDVRSNTRPAGDQIDLLSRLLNETDPETGEKLDMETARDQILMHMSNGFNGPSVTLSWLISEVADKPEIQENIIAEIDEITKGDPDYNLEYVDLLTMPYITQVIKEAMRVHPPLPVTVRNSLKDGSLGPYRVYKDDIILVGALAAQRDRRYWGDKPDVFDPSHFTPDKVARRHRLAFIPFSIGQRQCMAQEVAFMMIRIAVFYIFNRTRLRLAPGATVARRPVVSNTPVSVKIVRTRRVDNKEKRVVTSSTDAEAPSTKPDVGLQLAVLADWDVPSAIPVSSQYRHITIGFGSNFGSCRRLAEELAERGHRYGFICEIMPLDNIAQRPEETKPWLLIVCASTYTGNPPGNASQFKKWLDKADKKSQTWANCSFLVWGLGNTQWNAYLRFPTYIHNRLTQLGAKALSDMGSADVGGRIWESGFNTWQQNVWPLLINLAGAKPSEAAALQQMMADAKRRVAISDEEVAKSFGAGELISPVILANGVGMETKVGRVRATQQLCADGAPTQTRHIEIELPEGMTYQVGDHLGVCPENDAFLVESIAERFGISLDGVFRVPSNVRMNVSAMSGGMVLQVRNILTHVVDLTGPIPIELVTALMDAAHDSTDNSRLAELRDALKTGDSSKFRLGALIEQRVGILGLLEAFPQVKIGFVRFLQTLRPLTPRYYSISSCPNVHGVKIAHISVGLLAVPLSDSTGGSGRVFQGLSSSFLHGVRDGAKLNIFVDLAEGFHLHTDLAAPTIMVSAGTGFAPMRAFLHQLHHNHSNGGGDVKLGTVAVFNGIRRANEDYIYKSEIDKFVQDGSLHHLHMAMSREDPQKHTYVQHKLREQAALVNQLLLAGAHVYICGSEQMRAEVRAAFIQIVEETQHLPHDKAEAYIAELESIHRYNPDVWG